MRSILPISLLCAMSLISHLSSGQGAQVIYVKKGATGSANGTSWANAYPELRTALTAAASISGSKEIWVAQGEYKPTDNIDRTISFTLLPQTVLYGGFAGNETSVASRNWKQYRTVLSGDLGVQFDKVDNSFHVVVAQDVDQNTGIDGFVIKEGNADGEPAQENAIGGGIFILSTGTLTSPRVSNCEIIDNAAKNGAGLFAGILNEVGATSPQIINCEFKGNTSVSSGGAIFFISDPTTSSTDPNFISFINCIFSSNVSGGNGGAGAIIGKASFINCSMILNQSQHKGSALMFDGTPEVKNSILEEFYGQFW